MFRISMKAVCYSLYVNKSKIKLKAQNFEIIILTAVNWFIFCLNRLI